MFKKVYRSLSKFIIKMGNDNISSYSAESAFFLIMSIVPFFSILLNFVKFLPISKELIFSIVTNVVPTPIVPLANSILTELFKKDTGSMLSISIILLIWPAAKGIFAISKGLNVIFNEDEKVNFFKRLIISIFYTIFFVVVILATLLFFVFGNRINTMITKKSPWLGGAIKVFLDQKFIIIFITLTLFFALTYKLGKGLRSSFLLLFPGAIFSALSWILFSFIFSLYYNKFSRYSYTYGSLATIILLMVWLYFCMNFFFIGAEINSCLKIFIAKVRKLKESKK